MPEATIVEANDAFLALFEFSRDEVIGKTSIDLGIFEPAAQAEVRARFLRDGFVRHFECTRRT